MSLAKVTQVAGTAVYVPGSDIDTDRIIPARFMKCVTFDGLGEFAFYDVRKNADGTDREHPLNDKRFEGANILLSGSNFGCGSSREHAPQALYRFGFRAVIAESFAEIFFGNCTTLGIPCAVASGQDIRMLAKELERNPKLEVTVDLVAEKVLFEDQEFPIVVPHTAREALTTGQWDPIAELLKHKDAVADKVRELSLV
ncbi:3-isopropylmalate dehydratase small subunit [Roseimicrobium sp. ORNL1]|uniref:3-isopropylmalate dehydratase small subunit n=1 Tax=Roseimicrobium sp. ORNL1 TaxID=2711231 RepID=UPI0013E0F384|nr:3-isopropylmalate dehydratase small subunit [Roseimicrobium sp. ORNL1]QIF05896.1 3-isopropylmalate dehydratase small subunit [Roseimicrobium sp. ORNL1]